MTQCGILFDNAPSDSESEIITRKIILGGAFGNPEEMVFIDQLITSDDARKTKKEIIREILGTYRKNMLRKYPFLEKAPFLMPFCQIYRIIAGLIRKPRTVLEPV